MDSSVGVVSRPAVDPDRTQVSAVGRSWHWTDLSAGAAVVIAAAVTAWSTSQIVAVNDSNFMKHVAFAEAIAATGVLYPGHFLFHLLVVAIHQLVPLMTWGGAAIAAQAVFQGGLAWTIGLLLLRSVKPLRVGDQGVLELVVIAIVIAAPVTVFTWGVNSVAGTPNLYFGYVAHQVYTVPTTISLRPFALLQFVVAARMFLAPHDRRPVMVAILALLTVISILNKPNYFVCLAPVLGLLVVWRAARRDYADVLPFVVGIVVPGLLALVWVYVSTYLTIHTNNNNVVSWGFFWNEHGLVLPGGVMIAPFLVMSFLAELGHPGASWLVIFPKLLLSAAFPLAVLLLYFTAARRDERLLLAWLVFGIGLIHTYVLAEANVWTNGNFTWSGHISLFVLFVMSAVFLLQQLAASSDGPLWRGMLRHVGPRSASRSSCCTWPVESRTSCSRSPPEPRERPDACTVATSPGTFVLARCTS